MAKELSLTPAQTLRALELLDADKTIPFIARYRKEVTGGMDEVQLQALQDR
ncbi:MAG: Tex-like N-terminal domain-containing protein, partial [Dehalococcoidia bacterium]|nr:Tex-like N-terminal domain-containing protein [Dehalococcoidia bacterium]